MTSRAALVDGETVELFSQDELGRLTTQAKAIMRRRAEYQYVVELEEEVARLRAQLECCMDREEDSGIEYIAPKPKTKKKPAKKNGKKSSD